MESKDKWNKAYYEKDYDEDEEEDIEYQEYLNKKTLPQSRDEQLNKFRKQKNIDKLKKKLRSESDMKDEDDFTEEKRKTRFDPLRMFNLQWIRTFPCVNESIIFSSIPMMLGGYSIFRRSKPINRFRNVIIGSSIGYFVSLPLIFTILFHRYTTKAHRVLIGEPDDFNYVYISEEGLMEPDNYEATRPLGPDGGVFGDAVKYPKNMNQLRKNNLNFESNK